MARYFHQNVVSVSFSVHCIELVSILFGVVVRDHLWIILLFQCTRTSVTGASNKLGE